MTPEAILVVPDWLRPGAAVDYLSSDGSWWRAHVAYLTADSVWIEVNPVQTFEIGLEDFLNPEYVRRAEGAIRVTVPANPAQNVGVVGKA